MKIYIRENSGKRFFIPVPLALVRGVLLLGDVGVRIAKKHVDKETLRYLEGIDFKQLSRSLKYLREYRGLKIVEVRSSSGDEVTIQI